VLAIGRALLGRNFGIDPDAAGVEDGVRAQAAKRVGLRLSPVRTRSWDHRKLRAPAGRPPSCPRSHSSQWFGTAA